ncbi:FHA domain-containing protein [Streptomyces sp. NBC_01373]|uniref:FHA domain-containing protein n=1 Tax=Streptomyces sp. NBC_01373 TaxID=2903843 RepID=UPI002257E541|nr:FHA domain-containing protein [Streptomyces sp. NBC_01373]MCX4699156.1 FHA domain-containing protein [Streptomyces sp. NBC_01373]
MARTGVRPPYLEITEPVQFAGVTWGLSRSTHIMGRLGDIRLDSPDVSKRHAELRQGSDGVWLNDLGSRNGVLHNGTPIPPGQPVRLTHGDQLRLGSVQLTFVGEDGAAAFGPAHRSVHDTATVTDVRDARRRREAAAAAGRDPAPGLSTPPPPPSHAPPPPVDDDARSMTTRHLAAATQLDPWFAELVVRQVVDEPYRALAPVFGADLGVVTRWALAARRRRLARDLVLAGMLLCAVALIGLGVHAHLDEFTSDQPRIDWQPYALGALPALLLGWLAVAVDIWVTDYLVLRRRLAANHYRPSQAPDPPASRARDRLAAVAERPAGNLIVCSNYCPFAGSGFQVDEWDMPIDIRKGTPRPDGGRRPPRPFTTGELYDELVAAARGIGLNNLRVEERLFVDGLNVALDRRLLPIPDQPPLTRVAPHVMRTMPDGLGATRRSYVSIEIPAWSGQLVVTMYLRAVQVSGTLYLEWSAYALLPMLPGYYAVDLLPHRTGAGSAVRAGAQALPRLLPALLGAPRALARRASSARAAAARRRRQRRAVRGGYQFDYGAQYSVREFACGLNEGTYFLGRDLSRALHTTQQHLLNTVGDFLESRGIDSENFQRLQQNLVQNFTTNNDYSVRNDNRVKAKNFHNSGAYAPGGSARSGGGGGGARQAAPN